MFPWLVKFRTSWLHTKYALAASGTAIPIWVGIQARLGNEMKTPDLAVRANRESFVIIFIQQPKVFNPKVSHPSSVRTQKLLSPRIQIGYRSSLRFVMIPSIYSVA